VPKKLQDEVNSWGLSKGEFESNGNWPHQLYVREARRMIGAYVMKQADIMEDRNKDDSVGLGSYNTDSHHAQRVVGPDGFVLNEGDFQVGVKPYAIAYRSIVPTEKECENLLVPVCLSASHVAHGSIRMEPVFMILGQAAGSAASQAIDEKVSVQKIAVSKLQAHLKEQGAILAPADVPTPPGRGAGIDPAKLKGILVDDSAAKKTGEWKSSSVTPGYIGFGYIHDDNKDQGKKSVRFIAEIADKGQYDVHLFYPPLENRASNVLVVVRHAKGEEILRVNQKAMQKPQEGQHLGIFPFDPDREAWVEIRTSGANGYVIADAVLWVPTKVDGTK